MKFITFLSFIFCCTYTSAQKIEKFLDNTWKLSEPLTARYYALIEKTDSLWHRRDFYIPEAKLEMDGNYLDSACKIQQGNFKYYHPNGNLKSFGEYVLGKKKGTWLQFHYNGSVADSTFYDDGIPTGISLSWYPSGYLSDSSFMNKNESGVKISWFENGNLSSSGRYSAGKKMDGKWIYRHMNGNISSSEIYSEGLLVAKQFYDEKGFALSDTLNRDKPPSYKGGFAAWKKFSQKYLYSPPDYFKTTDKAVVFLNAVIDENGNLKDVLVNSSFGAAYNASAKKALEKSAKWLPAVDHNRNLPYTLSYPILYRMTGVKYEITIH